MRHLQSVPPPGSLVPESAAAMSARPLSRDELSSLLTRTSRTFALTIPLLDEPLATDVGLAYLLFRIADTLEDATSWGRDARLAALDSFGEWLIGDDEDPEWLSTVEESPPTTDEGCLALLARAVAVKRAVIARGPELSLAMTMDVVRTSSKMGEFVARQTEEGGLVLNDLEDLKEYCYAVAGIVGELLTQMFIVRDPRLEHARDALMDLAPAFGEGLQLVNILKDAPSDAKEGRQYLPRGVARAEVMKLARRDLEQADEYIAALEGAGASKYVRAFCTLPVRLAVATLDRLEQGAPKLTREEVLSIFAGVVNAP